MTSSGSPGHGAPAPFPPAEVESFHTADRQAGRNIIGLMGGIFTIGLLLYATVCYRVHINW